MSDLPSDFRERLDLEGLIARIDRDREEARKFATEQRKLISESRKFDRERFLAPLIAVVAVGTFVNAVVTFLVTHWR